MGYSIDPITADCYEGTTCLINKFGITDEQQLAQLIRFAGYDIHFSTIDTDELMTATIHAAGGVEVYLKQLFTDAIVTK